MKAIDLTGQRFGKLTAVSIEGRDKFKRLRWNCLCDCGNTAVVRSGNLRQGHTTNCGCVRRKKTVARNTTHGLRHTSEYDSWAGMIQRCTNERNPSYENYGGRVIAVCDRWLSSFENFFIDMGLKPAPEYTIERSNNNGHYSHDNCIWATKKAQANNRRSNRLVTIDGATRSYSEWLDHFNISRSTVRDRIKRGWSIEDAFRRPADKRFRSHI